MANYNRRARHYASAKGGDASSYLQTMRNFSNASYMIPEQVLDLGAPAGRTLGTPTGGMTPLNRTMGE